MEVKHIEHAKNGAFYLEVNGNKKAELTYKFLDKNVIDINHTEVDDSLKGQGIGYKLVDAAVAFLRKNNLKAKASCPYVKHVFEKKQEDYKDIISA